MKCPEPRHRAARTRPAPPSYRANDVASRGAAWLCEGGHGFRVVDGPDGPVARRFHGNTPLPIPCGHEGAQGPCWAWTWRRPFGRVRDGVRLARRECFHGHRGWYTADQGEYVTETFREGSKLPPECRDCGRPRQKRLSLCTRCDKRRDRRRRIWRDDPRCPCGAATAALNRSSRVRGGGKAARQLPLRECRDGHRSRWLDGVFHDFLRTYRRTR